MEPAFSDKFGKFAYKVLVPLNTPVIVFRQKQDGMDFTEILLPPGITRVEKTTSSVEGAEPGIIRYLGSTVKWSEGNNAITVAMTEEEIKAYLYKPGLQSLQLQHRTDFKRSDSDLSSNFDELDDDQCGVNSGASLKTDKVFYKGYWYKRQKDGRRVVIRTKHEGIVPIALVHEWNKKRKKGCRKN